MTWPFWELYGKKVDRLLYFTHSAPTNTNNRFTTFFKSLVRFLDKVGPYSWERCYSFCVLLTPQNWRYYTLVSNDVKYPLMKCFVIVVLKIQIRASLDWHLDAWKNASDQNMSVSMTRLPPSYLKIPALVENRVESLKSKAPLTVATFVVIRFTTCPM